MAFKRVIKGIGTNHEMRVENVMLAYADDIVKLGDTKNEVVKTIEKLIASSRTMNLGVDENKTMYLVMTRRAVNKTVSKSGSVLFWISEQV